MRQTIQLRAAAWCLFLDENVYPSTYTYHCICRTKGERHKPAARSYLSEGAMLLITRTCTICMSHWPGPWPCWRSEVAWKNRACTRVCVFGTAPVRRNYGSYMVNCGFNKPQGTARQSTNTASSAYTANLDPSQIEGTTATCSYRQTRSG